MLQRDMATALAVYVPSDPPEGSSGLRSCHPRRSVSHVCSEKERGGTATRYVATTRDWLSCKPPAALLSL